MTLLTAWNVLVHRYSDQDDVVTGVALISGELSKSRRVMATLPLRVDLADNPRFSDLLGSVRAAIIDARARSGLANGTAPANSDVVSDPTRHLSHETVFAFSSRTAGSAEGGPADLIRALYGSEPPACDIVVSLATSGGGVAGILDYDADLFREATVTRMSVHFENLLARIAAQPRERIGRFVFLTDFEQKTLISIWNCPRRSGLTVTEHSSNLCIHDVVAARARSVPNSVAAVAGCESLTYRDLDRRAEQLARYLRRLGARQEDVVALYMERSLELLVAMLGILKTGAAYLPIEPVCPRDRLAFMLGDAKVSLMLTQERLASSLMELSQAGLTPICIDSDWPTIAASGEEDLPVSHPHSLAYVIYTSGSTGRPKGVQVPHAALMNLAGWHHRAFCVEPSDRATQIAALGFDAAVWEIWPYLAVGASLHFPDQATRTSPRDLVHWLVEQQITISFVPTPLAEILLREDWPADVALRFLMVGGDKLQRQPPPSLPFTVVNNYGPTENAVVSTWHPVDPTDPADAVPPIGRPVDRVYVYVLDRYLNLAPAGVPGELYLAGAGLARGYLGQPALTAQRFIPNPIDLRCTTSTRDRRYEEEGGGDRLYRTGDLVRFSPDGKLLFLGRVDDQVKIRGFRIELGEIESVLLEHSRVSAAVVLVHEDGGSKELVAYVVPEREDAVDPEDLRRHLQTTLPEYMVPYHYVMLDSLPLTTNGKVDRKALPAPNHIGQVVEQMDSGSASRHPEKSNGDAIRDLCELWESILHLRARRGYPVAPDDDFLKSGGDSIRAMQLSLALVSKGIQVGAGDILRHRTVNALVEHLSNSQLVRTSSS